jgi:repressor LexA
MSATATINKAAGVSFIFSRKSISLNEVMILSGKWLLPIFLAAGLIATAAGCASPPVTTSQIGNLQILVKGETHQPLGGVKLVSSSQPEGQLKVTGITAADGLAIFQDIKAGKYEFYASRFDYEPKEFSVIVLAGFSRNFTLSLERTMTPATFLTEFPHRQGLNPLLTGRLSCYIVRTGVRERPRAPGKRMKKLSEKQRRIIGFINRFVADKGYPPSIRDIQAGCGISSTSVVDYNLNILESRGHIRRSAEVSRGITLLNKAGDGGSLTPVPIIGAIAAGAPIPVPTPDTWDTTAGAETIDVSPEITRDRQSVYALRVKGLSMIDALINDGDVVLMQQVSAVENGEMAAVWLKAEKEATLKKVYVEPDRVRLQPANSQMQPIYVSPENVEIQGRVIAVIRQLA